MAQSTQRSQQRPQQHPKLGQNFLVSSTAQAAIVDALGDLSQRTVVEIGPGRGALTALLAGRARRLIAIELDRSMAAHLREQFGERPSVTIIEQDVLKTDFAALAVNLEAQADSGPGHNAPRVPASDGLFVVGNLPYYITSDILLHLFAAHRVIERAVIMIQREVATRVAAHSGGSDYGLLSATTQLYARAENLFTLPPSAFSPPPQVHSTVLRLTMAPRFDELQVAPEAFIAFLRAGFAQKRKMLAKNLRNAGYAPDKIAAALAGCNIPAQSRAEELDLATMAGLFRQLRG
ncbi:MAG TPA: 16S rRNA (adenine(1518)-N(6)/adenine(1519)-N(6))-dimethyltransferase RsmA [Acidobacteriaceae bacterium]|jgi:16S rRNA (adenine1518-N6/adenine1519-N6)-dimethyltransferase|nr:16S rRNA (adenine(1518)-N(6)/adenine(1519)-N(6))-dimethyltransferase RsmA [Acidobacteriaceae bacterium]